MSTTCKIGIVKENGKVECVCCWRDGHPDNAGDTLANNYNTYEKAATLIAKGQIMDLGVSISTTRFQKPDRTVSEDDCKPITYGSKVAFFQADHGQRFTYLFDKGMWWMSEQE